MNDSRRKVDKKTSHFRSIDENLGRTSGAPGLRAADPRSILKLSKPLTWAVAATKGTGVKFKFNINSYRNLAQKEKLKPLDGMFTCASELDTR